MSNVRQSTTADQNFKTCCRCGQKFTGYGNVCSSTGCIPQSVVSNEFIPGEPWIIRQPISMKVIRSENTESVI